MSSGALPPTLRAQATSAACAFAIALLYFGSLHAAEPRLADYDGYFHIRFASLGPLAWTSREFPWMPLGIFAADRWVDHQLLFHALQWPFTWFLPLLDAAHASAAVFAAAAVAAFAWALSRARVPAPWIWAIVLLCGSRFFIDRMMMPRTQSVSLAFLFAGIALATPTDRGPVRWKPLAALGFAFAWTYHLSVALVPVLLIFAGFQRHLRPALAAAAGIGAGFVLHPQSPQTLRFFYTHGIQKVANASGQAVGAEWMPVDTTTWLVHTAPILLLFGLVAMKSTTPGPDTRAMALLAGGWAVASAFAVKWLEYAVPFGVFTVALGFRDRRWSATPLLALAPLLWFNGAQALSHIRGTLPPSGRLAGIAAHLPPSDCHVFHADWTDFSELFYHAPQCTLTVGLDPHFLSEAEPKRAALLEAALAGNVGRLGAMAKNAFGADWVVVTRAPMARMAAEDSRLELVYEDDAGSLWRVLPSAE